MLLDSYNGNYSLNQLFSQSLSLDNHFFNVLEISFKQNLDILQHLTILFYMPQRLTFLMMQQLKFCLCTHILQYLFEIQRQKTEQLCRMTVTCCNWSVTPFYKKLQFVENSYIWLMRTFNTANKMPLVSPMLQLQPFSYYIYIHTQTIVIHMN